MAKSSNDGKETKYEKVRESDEEVKKGLLPYYIDPEGKRRDPNRFGDPVLCNGYSRRTGKLCKNLAMKNGKCRVHGGKATGPKTKAGRRRVGESTSKRNFKTGEKMPIWYDTLTDEEQEFLHGGSIPKDAMSLLEEQLMFVTIRERRMMKMIMQLEDKEYDEEYEETWKRRLIKDEKDKPIVVLNEHGFAEKLSFLNKEGVVVKKVDIGKRIQEIEDALTRVQQQKFKLIDLKHKLEQDEVKEEDGSLKDLVNIIATARKIRTEQTERAEYRG